MLSTMRYFGLILIGLSIAINETHAATPFRVLPYLQHPTQDAMTICWFSNSREPGIVHVEKPEGKWESVSTPQPATALIYNPFREEPAGPHPAMPYQHRIRVTDLRPNTEYKYAVRQDGTEHSGVFRTAPDSNTSIRFVLYSDSETEPESTNNPVDWPVSVGSNRPQDVTKYVVDQTTGYRENLKLIRASDPHFISIVGDLVETGGEQRDWDEFWRHNAGTEGTLASRVPILPSLGNHENYAGPGGGYTAEGANFATDKFLTYFDLPSNGAANMKHRGRYYRLDYGPITLITLDSSDGQPNQTQADTNFSLEGSRAPDFNPNSEQYRWLVEQLASAQKTSKFTFVQFHHTMYGSGPHSVPFGHPNFSGQSGIAMRILQPLLFQYGVDAVFSGHDEMLERSMTTGTETRPDGTTRPHTIHFYDVGIGGDGLRGPSVDFDNPYRQFLAHANAPEVWDGKVLVSGGKHYGHVEVNVSQNKDGQWQAVMQPVYAFPQMNAEGKVIGWERRVYADVVTITNELDNRTSMLPSPPTTDRTGILAACLVIGLSGLSFLFQKGKRGENWRLKLKEPRVVS